MHLTNPVINISQVIHNLDANDSSGFEDTNGMMEGQTSPSSELNASEIVETMTEATTQG